MIVESGRKLMKKAIMNTGTDANISLDKSKFHMALENKDIQITSATTTYDDIKNNIITDSITSLVLDTTEGANTDLKFTVKYEVTYVDPFKDKTITAIDVLYGSGTEADPYILFSRDALNPSVIRQNYKKTILATNYF